MIKNRKIMFILVLMFVLLIASCSPKYGNTGAISEKRGFGSEDKEMPDWFEIPLTDVQTGEAFTVSDFSGKVVLVETMAMWCPNCIIQANEVRNLHKNLGNPENLVSISLDVDVNEDAASLKEYSEGYDFEWIFAIAPLEVARALGNLYSAQYLNPPLSPMLVVDRNGAVHELPYGQKKAADLLTMIQPFLDEN